MARRPVIGVMGAGDGATAEVMALAEDLGRRISQAGWALLSGGRPVGVMAAASRGAMAVEGHLVIGVLPGEGRSAAGRATAALDVALFTGMGSARNVINVLSADVVVVCGAGGPGTASEAAHALDLGRPLVLLAAPEPWPSFFGSLSTAVQQAADPAACCRILRQLLG
jgi:hypothetical protein